MKCWHGFMTKMNIVMVLTWMKCRCGLNANKMLRQLYDKDECWHEWSVDIASWQSWILARLQYKDRCWHGFVVKTLYAATLQRLLKWLRWKDKCWYSLIAKESMLHNKNKQQQRAYQKKISWHVYKKKSKRELHFQYLACEKKKKIQISMNKASHKEKKKKYIYIYIYM